jgi:hypothetical protein
VRMWPPFPTRSTIAQCPCRIWTSSFLRDAKFRSSESASEQDGDHGHVSGAAEAFTIGFLKKQTGLIMVQPVAGPRAELLHAFDSSDPCRQFRTQEPESAAS